MTLYLIKTFSICLGLTILLELSFALFFGIRGKKNILLVILVQIVTNPCVVFLILWCMSHLQWPQYAYELPIEAVVVIVEGLFYKKYMPDLKRPFSFSLAANYFSYSFGFILTVFNFW